MIVNNILDSSANLKFLAQVCGLCITNWWMHNSE